MHTAMLKLLEYRQLTPVPDTAGMAEALQQIVGLDADTTYTQCPRSEQHTVSYNCTSATGEKGAIFIVTNRCKIGMAHLKAMYHCVRAYDQLVPPVHLVTRSRMSSFAQQSMRFLQHIRWMHGQSMTMHSILWADVLYNPLEHYMVPPHKVVSRAYVNSRMGTRTIRSTAELPKIKMTDPVVRYLGLQPGQIVAIQRTPHEEAYRVVTN